MAVASNVCAVKDGPPPEPGCVHVYCCSGLRLTPRWMMLTDDAGTVDGTIVAFMRTE